MADQRPKLPIPTAEDIKKFKAVPQGSGKTPLASTSLPIPTAEDIKKFKATEPVEKKKPMASPSVLEKPAVSSVTGLRPLVPSSESISPRENEVIEKKPTSMLGAATQPSVSVTGSQGKLLIPERKEKFPAITETVTTFRKVPVVAPSKETKNLPLNPELMLQAIAGNERGKLGELTSVKSKSGVPNTARGTYQITEGTLETIFKKDANFKKSYDNFNQFKKDFNTNPDVEHQAALSHMMDLVETHGINALLAWFSPTHAARAAAGDKKALREIPGRSAGNTTTAGNYYNSALSKYRSLLGKQPDQQKTVSVPIKKEVIKEPAVEVPSLEKFNVLSPTWYNPDVDTKIDVKETVKNLTLKNKQLVSSYKDYKKEKEALNAEIEQLNLLSSNPANMPLVAAKQREIEARSLQLDNTFDQLSSEAERAKDDEASLNVAMVKSATDKAKQGSWGGAIWNSFVEGYKSIGKAATRNTSNALIELFDAIGVPYAADKKMTKDEAKKNIINEFIPIIEKGYDVVKSKGTTQEFIAEKQKEGYIPKALLGLAQSAPTMLSGNYGAFVNGALQTYDGVVKGMDDDPFTATMTENEKNTVAMPIALIGGVLEQIGFRTVLGKSKPVLFQFSKYVISKLPANAGIQVITNAVESAAKSKIGRGILAGTGAYLGEAETGGAQYVTEVGIKELYDQIQGVDLFKNPSMLSKEFAYKALEDAHVEGLGGLMIKGMAGGINMTVGGVKGKMDDASYKLWSDMMNDEDQVSIYKAQIQSDLANNKITREEAQLKMDETDRARGIISQIPTDLSTRNQREAFSLIAEKQSLTTAIAGKEPSLVSKQSDRIKQIDEQLKQISNAVQEQTTSEVSIQPEAGASLQMAEGEPQAEPQVPTEESKKIKEKSINKVFEANPELKNIGSAQQYSDYLDTVFPDTKVKDIVYHGSKTKKPTEGFLETSIGTNNKVLGAGKGFYFTKDIDYSKNYGETTFSLIDVKNPTDFNSSQYNSIEELENAANELPNKGDAVIDSRENKYYPQGEEKLKSSSSPDYIVFKPEQIYTLGSEQDIEGFKKFVSKESQVEEVKSIFPNTKVEKIVYHDSDSDNISELKAGPNGIFATADKNWWQKKKYKYKVALDIKNPKIISEPLNSDRTKEFFADPKNSQYDAIITTGPEGDMSTAVYVVRNPSQTKVLGKVEEVPAEEGQEVEPAIAAVDITTPTQFKDGEMPEIPIDQIDWEASGMGSMQEAIDMFGGINDISVVEVKGKNENGEYVGKVRVVGQDTSKEGDIVFKDPNAPAPVEKVEEKPKDPKFESAKQLLKDKGVYPLDSRVNDLIGLSENNPGQVTGDQVGEVIKVNKSKAQTIANALNRQVKQETKQVEKQQKQSEEQVKAEMNVAVDLAIETAKSEGLTKDLVADAGIEALRNTNGYKDADQQQRDLMEDGVRKKAGVKRKAAPSVKKVLGIKPKLTTVNDAVARNEQIRLEIKAAKGAVKAVKEATAKLVVDIKELGQKGKLTPAQTRALLNGLNSNLLNPVIRDKVFARAKKIIENANYAKNVEDANSIRTQIRKALSADNKKKRKDKLQASVANMASNLAKVAPKMVDDIDLYLERANEVLAAIRNPKITDVEVIGRMAADINAVNEYAKDEFNKQEQARKDEMLAQYDYLVEAGILNESMSLRDINKLVAEIMDGKPVESDKLKEAGLVFFRSLFNDYSQIINKMLSGTDPITGEDTDISQGDKELVRRFLAIDPDKVTDLTDMFNIANAAQEFITNDIIDNMEVMVKNNQGLQNVRMDAENPKMRGYKAVLPWVANFAKLPIFSKIINIKLAPVQEYIRNIFRGETNAVTFEKNSGFTGIYNGSTKAMTDSDIADTEYVDKFYNKKPNGKKFFDVSNVFERGIFADLYRTTFGTEAEVQEEFERKVGQLELTIKEKEKSDKKIDQEEASELQKSYNKIVKGSKNINDVMSKMAKDNIDGVMWWIDKWDSKFPEIDRVAKSTYNDVLERQANYTPEGWVKIADQVTLDDDMLSRSFNKMNMSYVDTRRAGTLMKYSASKGLPINDKTKEVTHVKSYHFDINNSESFKKTLKDVYTAPSIVQYMAYTNSPEFSTIIPDKKTRDNLKEKIAFAINALKDTEIDISAESYRDYNKAMKKFTDIARAQALVSVKTPIMQTVPVVVGTAIDLVNDPASFAKGMVTTFNMDFHKALNKAGYGISVRGLEAIAALDAAEKRIRESKGLDLNVFNNIAKISNLQLKYLLSKPDIVAARQAWVSYYLHKLKSMGISTANIDWNTHEFNDEAANYAERKTNSKLNQNIQEMAGQAFASRSQKMRFIRNTVLNFASFAYNMKYRFWTDLTILGSKNSNSIDKADAAKDIVRTTGEGALYVYIGAIVGHYLKGLMFDLVGYDEPEEDKKSAEEYLNTNMLTKGILDLLSPMPGIGDLLFVKGINNLADLAFGEQEKEMPNKEKLFFVKARPEVEKQFRLYEPPEKTESETYLSLLGGMSGIFGKNVNELYKSGKLIQEGEQFQIPNPSNPNKPLIDKKIEYTDKFDNKIEFSNKEKEMMKLPFLLQTLGTIGLGVRDQAETANKVRRSLEKRAKKRMAASKKEKLFYVPKAE